MTSQLLPTAPCEKAELTAFLRGSFHAPAKMNSFDPDVLEWKYFSRHPDWTGPRSYVVKSGDVMVAHGGIWPVRLVGTERELSVIHLIDWAASRTHPGAGVLLLRKFSSMSDLLLTIGGSADTRAILPKLGYRLCGELKVQAKVVRPFRQLRKLSPPNWKTPLRVLRNVGWSLSALPEAPRGWEAAAISQFNNSVSAILERGDRSKLACRRTVDELNHFLICPGAKFSAFTVSNSGRIRGYFMLSQFQGQTRIVEVGTDDDPDSRTATCMLAARTAAALPDTSEIVSGFTCAEIQRTFSQIGFKVRRVEQVFCYDPRKILGAAPELSLSMLDGDLCFLGNRDRPYLS
jgi:hypothetical protein